MFLVRTETLQWQQRHVNMFLQTQKSIMVPTPTLPPTWAMYN
jgi:hypothetical protein